MRDFGSGARHSIALENTHNHERVYPRNLAITALLGILSRSARLSPRHHVDREWGKKTGSVMAEDALRFIDLFCGIGGIRLGFERACSAARMQSECVYSADIDDHACAMYRKNFAGDGHDPKSDVTKVTDLTKAMGRVDIVLAGFPCQAFSIAGSKRGFEETRGTLFFDVARIIEDRKPKAFILENVKGLVMHRSGRTLTSLKNTIASLLWFWRPMYPASGLGLRSGSQSSFLGGTG